MDLKLEYRQTEVGGRDFTRLGSGQTWRFNQLHQGMRV